MNPRLLPRVSILLRPSTASVNTARYRTPSFGFPGRDFSQSIIKMADRVHRVTMFKLPSKEDQDKLLNQYKILGAEQQKVSYTMLNTFSSNADTHNALQKDGKPYILSMVVGPAEDDARAQGYTLVSKTEFANMDDMKYYDEACKAHDDLKVFVKTLGVEGVLTIFFKPTVVGGTDSQSKL
jgi:hypothetical protein